MEPTRPRGVEFGRIVLSLAYEFFHVSDFVNSANPVIHRWGVVVLHRSGMQRLAALIRCNESDFL